MIDTAARLLPVGKLVDVVAFHQRNYVRPKDEFETTAAFASRIGRIRAPIGFVALPLSDNCRGSAPIAYDADDSSFVVLGGTLERSLILRCSSQFLRSYEAKNAYNASKIVKVFRKQVFALILDGVDELSGAYNVPMRPALARQVKPQLRLAAVARFDDGPFALKDSSYIEPEFSNPEEVLLTTHLFAAKAAQLWVYNGLSGLVYAKFDLAAPAGLANLASAGTVPGGAATEAVLRAHIGKAVILDSPTGRQHATLVSVGSVSFTVDIATRWSSYEFSLIQSVSRGDTGTIVIVMK